MASIVEQKPTVVFSLGAWTDPSAFDAVRSELKARGIPSEAPAHPSMGAEPPTKTLGEDRLINEGDDVIIVAHSYGGVVASCAVEGLDKNTRAAAGLAGGVSMVVYMSAFVVDHGQSLADMLGGELPSWTDVDGNYVRLNPSSAVQSGLNDLPPSQQEKWSTDLPHGSRPVFFGPATYCPWLHGITCAYILCTEDKGLVLPVQEAMAAKLETELVYRLKSSHSPFLSVTGKLAGVLDELAGKIQVLN